MNFLKKLFGYFKIDLGQKEMSFRTTWRILILPMIIAIFLTALSALAVFFLVVKSPEQVLVPDVVGSELTDALQEMQIKELYPKIQLQYSSSSDDKGTVLSQSPSAGSIVKAGRRINLVVSQGVILDRVGDYVGMDVDSVRAQLQTIAASFGVRMITLSPDIMYQENEAEAGTILEQNPPSNTSLSGPVTLELVVSSGPGYDYVEIPNITGLSLNDALLQMNRNRVLFLFTAQTPQEGQEPGRILSQTWPADGETRVPIFTRVNAVIAIPQEPVAGLIYGIVQEELPRYPYALLTELTATPTDGETYSIVSFYHTGGTLSIPYAVEPDTRLTLTTAGNEVLSFIVQ
ncbi:MAG: PASTA domain-containing protein [Spirochaetales bacterium]